MFCPYHHGIQEDLVFYLWYHLQFCKRKAGHPTQEWCLLCTSEQGQRIVKIRSQCPSCYIEEREGLIQGCKCRKFDNLVQACSKIIVISGLSPEDIASAKCSCRQGMKKHLCKHVIGLGIQLGYPNWEKRPWGRPSKAKKAKIIQ